MPEAIRGMGLESTRTACTGRQKPCPLMLAGIAVSRRHSAGAGVFRILFGNGRAVDLRTYPRATPMTLLPKLFVLLPLYGSSLPHTVAGEIRVSSQGPVRTLVEARDAARKLPHPVTIRLEESLYSLSEPLLLGAEDSQTTWQAAPGASVVISGGRQITGWTPAEGGLWKADIADAGVANWKFEQLWVNGRRATRARTPNTGFFHMTAPATVEMFPGTNPADPGWVSGLAYEAFVTKPEMFAELAEIKPDEGNETVFIIPHTWEVHRYRLRELNAAANAVHLNGPHMAELLKSEPDGRFRVENFRAALDSPGEWFLARDGSLFYQPLPGENMATASVVAPLSEKLLGIDGARDVSFRGITFHHQNWNMGPNGHGDPQAAVSVGAAIEVSDSRGVEFLNCEVAHVGGNAIWFKNGCRRNKVLHCHLHDLGAGGVKVGLEKEVPVKDASGEITIHDNIIQHGGRIFPAAVGVLIGNCGDNVISHNDIGDFYYSAVSLGWVWGYKESGAMRNRVENNHLYHLGWGFTSDMGGVYNLGPSFGTVIRGNHIHHVASYRYGGWGLYTDEGSSGVLMENNLVHDTSESSFHQHYGFYNQVRNNILAFGGKAQIQRSRAETRLSFILENNIIVWDPAVRLLDGTKDNWAFQDAPANGDPREPYILRNNLYWPVGGTLRGKIAGEWTWDEWKKSGRDAGSMIADPLFADLGKRDFTLGKSSPARALGFQPWDLAEAGVSTAAGWRDIAAKGWNYPNWEKDSKPWPSPVYELALETFETMSPGTCRIPRAEMHVENKGDSIGVTDEVASPIAHREAAVVSKRSLKLQDAADLAVEWSPHLAIPTAWKGGTVEVSFDVMARAGEKWLFEMRDANQAGYLTGAGIGWENGKISATGGDQAEMPVAVDQWVRVEVKAVMGSGEYSVKFVREDGEQKEFESLPCPPQWNESGYLVWISLGTSRTALFLDNLSMRRK